MEDFGIGDILEATGGCLTKGEAGLAVTNISTDSRTLNKGDLFVALVGEKFDGHNFISQALKRGASGVVVSRDIQDIDPQIIIIVNDTLKALGDIARAYRKRFDIPFIGITGSNGKTTTKDMTWTVLSRKYSVLKNEGNLNNAIGVPLTLFQLSKTHEVAIIEMGTGSPGEMGHLIEIVCPDIAVMTNVGPTHLEFFGSIENIAAEKAILTKAANSAVLNADDPLVLAMSENIHGRIIYYGLAKADVIADGIDQDKQGMVSFNLAINGETIRIELPHIGIHSVYNCLAAASVGVLFDIDLVEIKRALELSTGVPKRMEKFMVNGFTIIDDTYNSNLASLRAALNALTNMKSDGRRIAVIGDMLELGDLSDKLHWEAGLFIADSSVDLLLTVGDRATRIADAALFSGISKDKVFAFKDNSEVALQLHAILHDGDTVLIKGSRGMKMEQIVDTLKE